MSSSRVGSLGGRLSRWLALQSLIGLVAVCSAVYATTVLSFRERQVETLQKKETQVRHLLAEASGGLDTATVRHKLDDVLIGYQDLSLSLRDSNGVVFYEQSPLPQATKDLLEYRFSVAMPSVAGRSLTARLTLDRREDQRLLRRLGLTLIAAAFVGTALVSAGAYALVRMGLRPVRDLVEQTRQLAADKLHRRLDGSAQPEELEPLIVQFNELLARLSRAYEQLEGFNADVAHELCTPLATLIGTTEVALRRARSADELREVLGENLEDLQRIAAIVQDMLFLSQADRGTQARRVKVASLAALAQQVAEFHEASLADAELNLVVVGEASGEFDAALVQRALSNLLANAIRYAEKGSAVRIQIAATQAVGEVTLSVVNRGVPVEAKHLPRLFDRFYRADPSRSDAALNHGLGLTIVSAIARMHAGYPIALSSGGLTTIGMTLRSAEDEFNRAEVQAMQNTD